MSSVGDGLLLDAGFMALKMSSFKNKVNKKEFSWVSYFLLSLLHLHCFWSSNQ